MPGYTTRKSIPYPLGSDLAGYTIAETMARDIDSKIDRYRHSTGSKFLHGMGMYEEKAPNLPGWIVILTDIPFASGASADKMVRIDVRGWTYWPYNNIVDFSVNFYMLNGGLFSVDFHNNGSMLVKDVRILRYNATPNRLALAFKANNPAGGDVWQYPKIIADAWVSWGPEISDAQFTSVVIQRDANIMNPQNPAFTSIQQITQADWISLPLYNGWYQYDGGGTAGHAYARYRRENGWVFLEGLVVGGPLTSDISGVPPGFRHNGGPLIFNQHGNGGNSRVDVHANGAIVANGIPANGYLSLNGICWPLGNA